MKKFLQQNKVIVSIVLLLFAVHLSTKDYTNPYQRSIQGDAQGYYAYLPAIFIYQDLSYSFVEEINQKYYPANYRKSFVYVVNDEKVNKTFPGAAILYAPAFFVAHGLALIFGLEADGYSTIYQVFFEIGYWMYILLGMVFFGKVLRQLNFKEQTVTLSSVVILLGTNLFFYGMYDPSVTHIFNFFMINALLFNLLRFQEDKRYKYAAIAIALLLLIGITRPTNILVFGLIVIFIPKQQFFKNLINACFRFKNALKTVIIGLTIGLIPFILWKLQTGNWVVYSYGDEGFNFSDPHFYDFLFSYIKGWFVYTPIAFLIILLGLIQLLRSDLQRAIMTITFYLLCVYVFSSWWCWYYGAGMSQRVMIDHYILLGFLFAIVWEKMLIRKWTKYLGVVTIAAFSFLNVAQAWQIRHGIIPMGSATKQQYWDNFLQFERQAKVYPKKHWQALEELDVNLLPKAQMLQNKEPKEIDGELTIEVSDFQKYSGKVNVLLRNHIREGSKIKLSFDARARTEVEETRLVYYFYPNDTQKERVFHLKNYVVKDSWKRVEILEECNEGIFKRFEFYFWNGGTSEKVEFRRIRIEHFFSDEYM